MVCLYLFLIFTIILWIRHAPQSQSRRFRVLLLVQQNFDVTSFTFNKNEALSKMGMGVEESDVLFNYTSANFQSMQGLIPWRGAREKDASFLQMLIEVVSQPQAIVLDAFASIGQSFSYLNQVRFL